MKKEYADLLTQLLSYGIENSNQLHDLIEELKHYRAFFKTFDSLLATAKNPPIKADYRFFEEK